MKFISRSVWHFPHSRCIGFALFTAVLAAVAQPHPTSTWTGAVDNRWDTAGNWDPSGVPPTNAIAVINSGTPDATLAGLIRVYEVDLNGGTFTLNGLLMLDGTSFVMQGGTLATGAGGGTIGTTNEAFFDWHSGSLDGVLSLATGAQARLSSAGGKYLDDGAELHNYGTVTWTDGPIIAWTYNGLATIRNHAGSSFIASGGTGLDLYYGYQTALFVVDTGAQFTKTDVLDVTENWVLQNDGRLAVNNGATRWNRGGASSGLFTNQPGGLFAFSGGTHTLAEGTLLAGDGSFRVEGGIVSANGVVTHGQPGSPGVLELAAGEITGSNFVAAGSFVWSGGSIGGLFTVLPGAVANLDGAGGKYLDDFALFENRGTVTWTDGPIIAWTYNGTATIHNHAGSSFLASGGTGLSLYYGNQFASFIVDADAQFTKTDALDVTENWVLQNDGRLAVNNGAARWNRGGASSGLFTNQPEGLFAFSGGTHTLADGTRLAGDGNFRVEGGVVAANGVVTHGQPGSPGVLELTAGEITGSNFVAAGSFVWSGGSMGGLFTVLPGAVANLNGPGGRYLDDFALFENRGTVTWTDGPIIAWTYNGPATILNSSNALFNLAANATPFSRYYGNQEFRFTNSPGAVLRQSVAATVPAGSIWLAQQGEVRVDTGVLQFNSPVTLADGGKFTGAGLVQQTGDNIYLSGRLTLDGTSFEQQNGNFVMGAGGGTIATTNSAFFGWKSGWLIGRLTTTNGTQTLVSGTDGKYLGDAAEWHNYGTVTWTDGPIVAWTYNGTATLFNHATGRCIASSSMLGLSRYYGYQDAFFINDGTLALGTPGGQTTVSGWRFTQNASGLLELALAGTNAVADFGVWTFDSSAALAGSVHVVLANGFTPAAGQVFTFLQAAPCSGGFSGVQLPTLPAGLTMSVDTDSSSASLRVDAMGPCAPPPAGLIAWFPADDSAADVVGLRQAQLQDPTGYTSGKVGRAFRFNGSSDQVLLGSWFNLQEFSVSMWVKAGLSQAAYADIIDNNHTGSRSWVVEYANSGDAAHSDFGWGLANIGYIPFSLTKGVWQHLALTIDTNHIASLYLDGALVGTAAGAGPIAYDGSQFLRLGAWGGGGRNLNGAIDDLIIFNRALAQGEIAAITAASITGICRTNASCVAPPPGLLGWWPGDGNTTNLVAGGDPAVLLSGTTTAPGLVGGAFSLDGTGLVSIGDLAGLQSATQITVMAWVQKTPGPDNIGGIIGKWDTGPNPAANSFLLFNGETEPGNEFINRGALALQFTNDSIGLVQGSSLLPGSDWASNHWTHVAATWNSADGLMKLYKNGALDGLATNGLGQTLRHHTQFTAKVGEWGPNTRPNSRWIGLIDEPMVFNRALASNEIAAIVAAGTTGLCRPDSGTTNQPPSTNTLPDLAVSAVITPATALIGQSVPVVFTLTNLGQTSAFGPWVNQFLSATNAAGLGTQSLSTTSFVSEIAPAGSVTLTQTVALPVSLSGGIYLGVRADSAGNVVEANESNNLAFAASSIWISAPDLLITQILPPAGGVMGQPAPIIFTITNAGDAVATGPWLQQILLAADTNGSGALSLGSFNFTNSLPPGGSVTVTQAVTLAIGAFGTRFLGVAADSANNVLESNEANNTSYATTATIISAPDLLVARITAPASGIMGQTAQIIFTLTNGGNSTALAPWSNQLLLASDTNGSGAQSLGSFSVTNSIPPGGSVTITQIVTLPLAAFGAQFLGVLTDSANDVPESNENNNIACAAGATMITVPDLAVTQIIAPAGGIMGRPAQIVFTLTNGGSSPALAPWANQILLATDANGAGAQVISTFSLTNDLAPGASVTITQAATLPAGAMGERFLGVLTDSANNVPESNDYNNAAYAALGTTITAPDLAVLQITAPATALMGQAVPLVFTLTNGGNATAFAPWLNQVFLATNTNGTGAQILGAADFTNDLAAGASVTVTQNVILPTGVFGVRYVGVVVDSANDVAESDENNNTLVASSGLLISGPDLAVTQLSAPTSARFGQSFAVLFAVTNVGTSPAGAAWQDQLFLSTVSNSVAGAISLGTLPGSSPLAPGEGYSRTQMVTLPLTVSSAAGNYFIVAATDASDAQAESSEANNLASVPIPLALPPLPDLAVPQVTAPATALPDRNVTVSWSLTNNGTASATGPWSETVAVSNAAYGLVVLAEFRFTNVLDAGQLLTRTQDVAVPNTLPAGDWNVLVLADARSEIVEGCEANNTGVATNLATVPALLTLQVGVSQIQEGAPPFFATVTRNGDRTTPLVVVITNSDPARLAITNTVTIPAGANSATFSVQAIHDNLVLGNEFVVFNVTNDSYQGDSWGLNVLEIDVPQLTLAFGAPSVTEGLTVPCTVSRDYETGGELVVVLNAADPTQLLPPASVTIPSNQLSYTFAVLAVDNNVPEPTRTSYLIASAAGFQTTNASVAILDNDTPTVTLTLAAHSVSEGAGPQATIATVTRSLITPRWLTLLLQNSDPGSVQIPSTVTIPANAPSVSFPVAALDNNVVDGTRTVTLRVFLLDPSSQVYAEGTGDTLQVLDDDGPTLKLSIDRDAVPEAQSPAATATITRNTSTPRRSRFRWPAAP